MIAFVLSAVLAAALQAAPAPAPVVEKPVCRRETPTGSIMSRRVCHTKAVWNAIDVANAAATDAAMDGRRNRSAPKD
jgi:hypothetical protein